METNVASHADAGKRIHQIHSQDQGQIQGGKSLGGDLGFRQGFTVSAFNARRSMS